MGASVASASAAIESMIRFTHNSCSTFRGMPLLVRAARAARMSATRLMVSWNCRNFRMLAWTLRPHMMLLTIELKLSSRMTMSLASLATSVPEIPMARPTWLSFSAGASFVPSPVTDTTSPHSLRSDTSRCLSFGDDRARTCSLGRTSAFRYSSSIFRNSGPSRDRPSVRMPQSAAMCLAVWMLSPVTIRTQMPASWQTRIAPGVSFRSGSLIPTMHVAVMFSSRSRSDSRSGTVAKSA